MFGDGVQGVGEGALPVLGGAGPAQVLPQAAVQPRPLLRPQQPVQFRLQHLYRGQVLLFSFGHF